MLLRGRHRAPFDGESFWWATMVIAAGSTVPPAPPEYRLVEKTPIRISDDWDEDEACIRSDLQVELEYLGDAATRSESS